MANKSKKISFEDWVKHIFDQPVQKRAWYFKPNAQEHSKHLYPRQTTEYIKQLFNSAAHATKNYSDAQVNQGFYYLISPAASDYAYFFTDHRVPLDLRIEAFTSIYDVFEQVFAVRCSPHLSSNIVTQADRVGVSAVNRVCYMWWDEFPLYGNSGNPDYAALEKPCLQIMKRVLKLDSVACRESALHGLGHWHRTHPNHVEGIVDQFLNTNRAIPPDLRAYALQARSGAVQ